MRSRYKDTGLVVLSWALVAVPASLLVGSGTVWVERLLLLSTALPLIALISRYLVVARRLANRNRLLEANLKQFELAEDLGGLGRWNIDLATRQHNWSEQMRAMTGLAPGTVPTDHTIASLFPKGLDQLELAIDAHQRDRRPFSAEFELASADQGTRMLRAKARNGFASDGTRDQVFMVVRDVTDEYSVLETVTKEREQARAEARRQRKLAGTDPLTGLANRRQAMSELDRRIISARSRGEPLSLMTFDLDHFKQVNDQHGHAAGDAVLREISRILKRQLNNARFAARIGGEEFLCILPDTDSEAASRIAERLRVAIEAGTALAPVCPVTASIGHATLDDGDTGLTLFARADQALYSAKRAGRNRVALAA